MNVSPGLDNEPIAVVEGGGLCPIVMACDEGFAMPLATALRSLCEGNERHWPLQVHILTDKFSMDMRRRVAESMPEGAADLHWAETDVDLFKDYPLPPELTPISLARLGIPQLFEKRARRALYLDADILVLGDLAELCNMDLDGASIAAVDDLYVKNTRKAGHMSPAVGMPLIADYFNSGVLLFDVDACIRRELTRRSLDYLLANPASPYPDQDALNVACEYAWKALDERWNFQGHLLNATPLAKLPQAQRPTIVHFVTTMKPWKPLSRNVYGGVYNRFRGRTKFRRRPIEAFFDNAAILKQRIRNRARRAWKTLLRPWEA